MKQKSLKSSKCAKLTSLNSRFAIIIGEDEVKSKKYTLKDMQEHEQELIDKKNFVK